MKPSVIASLLGIGVFAVVVSASRAAIPSLDTPPDARTEAMAHTSSVLGRGPFATWGNVGGLAFSSGFQLSVSRADIATDIYGGFGQHFVSLVAGFDAGNRPVGVGVNLTRIHHSFEPLRVSDHDESVVGVSGAVRLTRHIGLGLGLKRVDVNQRLSLDRVCCTDEPVRDTGAALDAGILAVVPIQPVSPDESSLDLVAGASIRNVGGRLEATRRGLGTERLPHEVSAGLGIEFAGRGRMTGRPEIPSLTVSASTAVRRGRQREYIDDQGVVDRSITEWMGGAELGFNRMIFLRGGYREDISRNGSNWTWGAGLAYPNLVGIDLTSSLNVEDDRFGPGASLWFRWPLDLKSGSR